MANDENGKEYNLPKNGSSLPSPGQILPDQCSSPTSRLYHLARLDSVIPPHLHPQYSMAHPHIASKNRDSLRELCSKANEAYIRSLEADCSGAKRVRREFSSSSKQDLHMGGLILDQGVDAALAKEKEEKEILDYTM